MNTEVLYPVFLKLLKALEKLLFGKTVLRVIGVIHDLVGYGKYSSGVVPAAHRLREAANMLGIVVYQGKIVKINYRTQALGIGKFRGRSIVGGKHYIVVLKAAGVGKPQLRHG